MIKLDGITYEPVLIDKDLVLQSPYQDIIYLGAKYDLEREAEELIVNPGILFNREDFILEYLQDEDNLIKFAIRHYSTAQITSE